MSENQKTIQLKVISDGTLFGTSIIDQESGVELEFVSFKIECGPDTGYSSQIWVQLPASTPVDVIGSLREISLLQTQPE